MTLPEDSRRRCRNLSPLAGTDSSHPLAHRLKGCNLYLVGMMGSGKSTAGRPLSAALGYRFIDADETLERAAGCSIPEIFARDGEAAFRDLETAVLESIAPWHSLVVATGGGVVTRPRNWGLLHQGLVVWLDASEELLLKRLRADPSPRPLLTAVDLEDRMVRLLSERRRLYAEADLVITRPSTISPAGGGTDSRGSPPAAAGAPRSGREPDPFPGIGFLRGGALPPVDAILSTHPRTPWRQPGSNAAGPACSWPSGSVPRASG
jgi:shikimate kinase